MLFYLGTHQPQWLGRTDVPLFISRNTLCLRRTFPRALGPWALDSGGYTACNNGGWELSARDYAAEVRRFRDEIGNMEWAAPQDWMCEPHVLQATGLTVQEHQRRTVANYLALRSIAPDLPFVPVLQGFTLSDYLRCYEAYEREGIDLAQEPRVGLGTVCRRQATREVWDIVRAIASLGLRLHGFGVKTDGLAMYGGLLESADSMAWSMGARKKQLRLPGHSHKNCANCMEWALRWRGNLLAPRANDEEYQLAMRFIEEE